MHWRIRHALRALRGQPDQVAAPPEFTLDLDRMRRAEPVSSDGKETIFCFSTGRSGTRWLSKIFDSHTNCHAGCDRFPEEEAFFRYVTWYDLPVDLSGFHALLTQAINYDWSRGDISFNASSYFCFGVDDLLRAHRPSRAMLIVRRPEAVVSSLYVKGWYRNDPSYDDTSKVPGVQPEHIGYFHRNMGRILPTGDRFEWWNDLTRIGKIAWYWGTAVTAIRERLQLAGNVDVWNLRLEDVDQNYEYYRFLAESFGLTPVMAPSTFLGLKGGMSNQGKSRIAYADWSEEEKRDYETVMASFDAPYDGIRTTGFDDRGGVRTSG